MTFSKNNMRIFKDQSQASLQRGLPVDIASESPTTAEGSEASVQIKYYNAGALTNDAGQAAGVVVVAKLLKGRIADELGSVTGTKDNTSLAFTSTALTNEVAFPYNTAETFDVFSGTRKAVAITTGFANGDYCVDYRTGTIYGVKASTQSTLTTVTYLSFAGSSASTSSAITSADVSGLVGKATGLTADFVTAYASATTITATNIPTGAVEADDVVSIIQIDLNGLVTNTYTRDDVTIQSTGGDPSTITVLEASFVATDTFVVYTNIPRDFVLQAVDETTFTPGASLVTLAAGQYSAAGDNVADGEMGALAMSIARHLLVQSDAYDSGTSSDKGFEINPTPDHHEAGTFTLTTVLNATPEYAYLDMAGYKHFAVQFGKTAGTDTFTMKVEATLQDDGTAQASCLYTDVTQSWFGVASFTADGYVMADVPITAKYVRFKFTTAGGGNDASFLGLTKMLY